MSAIRAEHEDSQRAAVAHAMSLAKKLADAEVWQPYYLILHITWHHAMTNLLVQYKPSLHIARADNSFGDGARPNQTHSTSNR